MIFKLKYYIRSKAPLWLYKSFSKVWNTFISLRNTLGGQKPPLLQSTFINFTYKKVFFRLKLDPKNGLVDTSICREKIWEPKVTDFIYETLNEGDVFLDIGANIGYFSLLGAKCVGDSGKVVAFEPIPSLVNQIKSSVKENNIFNIDLINKACGDKEGSMVLTKYDHNIGKSSLINTEEEGNSTEVINVLTIDSFCKYFERINLIKLDVEGFEPEVLMGAKQTLRRLKPIIIFEFAPKRMLKKTDGDEKTKNLFKLLDGLGYELESIKGEKIINTTAFTQRQISIGSYVEIVCKINN
jgi:FkbM family methyltransferase